AKEGIVADQKAACSELVQGCKDRIEVALRARMQDMELEPEGARRVCSSVDCVSAAGVSGLTSAARMFVVGTSSCSSSSRFDPNSTPNTVTPVRLPPGRLRLVTSPTSTGSNPMIKTIGIVVVAAFAAGAEGLPIAAITVT